MDNYALIQFLHTERKYGEVIPKNWLFATNNYGFYQVQYPIPQFNQKIRQQLQQKICSSIF